MQLPKETRTVKETAFTAGAGNERQTTPPLEGSTTVEKGDLPRILEIWRELSDIERRQKNLMQELYGFLGIQADLASSNTSRNRLTPEQARRLCMQARR